MSKYVLGFLWAVFNAPFIMESFTYLYTGATSRVDVWWATSMFVAICTTVLYGIFLISTLKINTEGN